MAKKNVLKLTPKKEIKLLVEKNLETLLVKLDPDMGEKKFKKRIKKAGKILVRGIKVKETSFGNNVDVKEVVTPV
jgi:predicted secreted protein